MLRVAAAGSQGRLRPRRSNAATQAGWQQVVPGVICSQYSSCSSRYSLWKRLQVPPVYSKFSSSSSHSPFAMHNSSKECLCSNAISTSSSDPVLAAATGCQTPSC